MEPSITSFVFDSAAYRVSNGQDEVLLRINYKQNTYTIEISRSLQDTTFQQQVKTIAADLLKRKHGVNFVDRVSKIA